MEKPKPFDPGSTPFLESEVPISSAAGPVTEGMINTAFNEIHEDAGSPRALPAIFWIKLERIYRMYLARRGKNIREDY